LLELCNLSAELRQPLLRHDAEASLVAKTGRYHDEREEKRADRRSDPNASSAHFSLQ
jgi:hypothetical protein